jgi:molybdopterin-guanine dinucleotide biosynthesis protein
MGSPVIIGIGGFTSNVGKTTLLCELLKAFPGWEAIKTTRGHYRSCGKDPKACCVSHLLSEEPLVRSGRDETYALGKDTGRYWDAGATNVHWVICTDNQVEEGIKQALARVKSPGVFVEGNSFSEFVNPDHFVMVRQASTDKIKSSARRLISKATAIYVSDTDEPDHLKNIAVESIPLFTSSSMFSLIGYLQCNRSILS